MFSRLEGPAVSNSRAVTVYVEGRPVVVREGDNAAVAAMLGGLVPSRRTPVTGAPRAPYCMMGVCFDCLMTLDGVPSRQGCMEPVRDGMRIDPQPRVRMVSP